MRPEQQIKQQQLEVQLKMHQLLTEAEININKAFLIFKIEAPKYDPYVNQNYPHPKYYMLENIKQFKKSVCPLVLDIENN